jgi:hypothetical protein
MLLVFIVAMVVAVKKRLVETNFEVFFNKSFFNNVCW